MTLNPYMKKAFEQAEKAQLNNDVPVGAVLVHKGEILAAAGNQVEQNSDPTAHAELIAMREGAKKLGSPRLTECDLYVTLEPCAMCAQAAAHARIKRLYFAAYDPKGGGVEHGAQIFHQKTCHHTPEVYGGIMEEKASKMLKAFFKARR